MSRPRILPVTGAAGAVALPAPPGDPERLRACAARLRRAQGEARSLPSLRGQLGVVLPEVWVGAAADDAVREAGAIVRRCSEVLDHLGGAATALDRHAADLEVAQDAIRRLQREWDRLREEHTRQSLRLRSRAAVDSEAALLLLRLGEQHDADLLRLTRLRDRCEAQLAAAAQRTTRLLAALDDRSLPRQIVPDAPAMRSRLGVGLPITTGAFTSATTAAAARADGARLRAAPAGDNHEVMAVIGSLRGEPTDPVYAQALVDDVGVGVVEALVLELAMARDGSGVDRSRASVGILGTLLLTATVPGTGGRDPRTERQVQSTAALLRDALVTSLGVVSTSGDGRWTATGAWLTGQLLVGARAAGWTGPLPPTLVRRLAAGIASAELAETRDDDATRHMGTSLPHGAGSRFASLFDDADSTGDALHVVLGHAGAGEKPSEVAALLEAPVDGRGVTGSRGGPLVLAEALVRRWVTVEAGTTSTHDDLDLATNADLARLVAIVDQGEGMGGEGRSAGLRARVMTELVRTSSYAQQSSSMVPIYERNTAPLETTAVGWVLDMPEAIDALILQPLRAPGSQWIQDIGGRHEPLLTHDELTGLIGAFAVGTDRARSAKSPDAAYAALVEGELQRARTTAPRTGSVERTALRLGFFEQAASAALVTVARRQDAVNQSMWRTLAEAKALALSWRQGPVAFGSAVATVVGGDTNRTAADDLTISLVRSDVELEQTIADEARSRGLASVLASTAGTPSGAASTAALFAAGARRGTALPSSDELVAVRGRERLDALSAVAQEKPEDRARARTATVLQQDSLTAHHLSPVVADELRNLPRGRSAHTHVVDSDHELAGLFERLTEEATRVPSGGYPGVSYRLTDGTVVRTRSASLSGGPTIDISLLDGSTRKVHVR